MAYVADILAIYACTELTKSNEPNTIEPLVEYLETGKPLTPCMREWLVALLKRETDTGHYLEFKRAKGRRTSVEEFEERSEIYDRVLTLRGTSVTNSFCEELLAQTLLKQAPHVEKRPSIYRLGWDARDYMGKYVRVTMTLRIGKTLNTEQVHNIVAGEFGTSVSTVERAVLAHEKARIDLTSGLTAFVGVNGAGKTAVMQALQRLFGITGDHRRLRR